VSCHARKVRCDILDTGPPCTLCAVHNRADCRLFPKKRERARALAVRQKQKPAPLEPRDPAAASSSASSHAAVQDEDPGNLEDFLGRGEVRDKAVDHRGRICYIGVETSNFNYLVRQGPARTGDAALHLGNRQFSREHTAHNLQRVPAHVLERPDKALADRLVQAYFEHVNCGWPVIDQEDFMMQYKGSDPQVPLSLTLLNAVLLVGASILAPKDESVRPLLPVFFDRVKTLVDCRYDQDRAVYVQVAVLLTWYSDGLEEIVANAWYWIGMATRTAHGLGMHRDASKSKMLPVHKRQWTRLWWVLFQFDTVIAASYGKPQTM
jgi:transcriptional regulatory protein AMDR